MKIIICLMMMLSLTFVFLIHPVSMGLILLVQTVLVSLFTLMVYFNSWFSYMIFLILVGGLLVLFIYMTSIASNEKFDLNLKMIMIMVFIFFVFVFYELNVNFLILSSSDFFDYLIILSKFIQPLSNYIMLFLMIYLFITLIATVKISMIKSGPLRQMFN